MKLKRIIFLSTILFIMIMYLFTIRNIEVFDFKDEQIIDYHISYSFIDKDFKFYTLEDKQVFNNLINRIKRENYRKVLELKSRNATKSYTTGGWITIRVWINGGDEYFSYVFDIDGSGKINYRKYKNYKEKSDIAMVDNKIKIGLWNNKKIKTLYSDLKSIIQETL